MKKKAFKLNYEQGVLINVLQTSEKRESRRGEGNEVGDRRWGTDVGDTTKSGFCSGKEGNIPSSTRSLTFLSRPSCAACWGKRVRHTVRAGLILLISTCHL
jgi:hypothetical protein